jgi:bifunctional non-homologous end joining protein LigD
MIVGYEWSEAACGKLGGLLLTGRRGDSWVSVGSVGAGFSTSDAEYLRKLSINRRPQKPVVPLKDKNLVFAQPTLIAEIEFADGRVALSDPEPEARVLA